MVDGFFDTFVTFVTYSVPYVITWEIGMRIVNALLGAVTGRRFEF